MLIAYTVIQAPPGPLLVAETQQGLVHVAFGPDGLKKLTGFAKRWFPEANIQPAEVRAASQIQEYLTGKRTAFDLELEIKGTDFQKKVWQVLAAIPYGRTMAYGDVAREVGRPNAARAVGRACGANPISLVIPCHRVLGTDGTLTGFGGGLNWKKWLLDLEGYQGR
ncbi:MAG: methylated-DNA--[protein]-cysteine S-methyltransferase [Deltaproteobacteria bacterium]|nr:methylated-DNA--[protein]-cysteine S-methyltransferase [Deltaproteobacteria bacterium]